MKVFESDIPLQELKQTSLLRNDSTKLNSEQTDSRELCGVIKPNADVTISVPAWDSNDDTPHDSK